MQNQYAASGKIVAMAKAGFTLRQVLAVLVMMFSMAFVPCVTVAAPEQEHEHGMDHSEHQHAVGQTGHEHHMSAKPGVFSSTVTSYTIPDVKLVDMYGAEIALHDIFDGSSPIILNFIFTSCTTICPVMSATFQEVQQQLGPHRNNARMVSISIDPENDTPAKLKEYASKYGVGPQWKMLTGTLDNSIVVQRAFGIFNGDKMNHTPVTFMKEQGLENPWVRLDGLVNAPDIIREFDKLNHK